MVSKKDTQKIKAVIGLGNEGAEYAHTYHNAGQIIQAELQRYADANPEASGLIFFTPSGFMNNIGLPVKKFLKTHNLSADQLLIIHDDSDQALGSFKLTSGGGSGGHKGIENIIQQLKTEEFWRLKIGIRDPNEQSRKKAGEFVLRNLSPSDQEKFAQIAPIAWTKILPLL